MGIWVHFLVQHPLHCYEIMLIWLQKLKTNILGVCNVSLPHIVNGAAPERVSLDDTVS